MRFMCFKRGAGLLGLMAGALLMAGCANMMPSQNPGGAQAAQPAVTDDSLRIGDKVKIELSGLTGTSTPEYPREQTIKEDGTVTMTYLPPVKAAGKTPRQLEAEIQELYVPKIYQQVTVSVMPMERFYYVGGQVRTPDKQLYVGAVTVSKAIQAAGDFTEFANRTKVQITRVNGKVEFVNYKHILKHPEQDLPIYPGDSIFVDRRW